MLIAIIFILLFFRYAKRPMRIPYKEIDGRSMFIIAAALLFSIYIFTYGKTLDWFSSPKIRIYTIAIPILFTFSSTGNGHRRSHTSA